MIEANPDETGNVGYTEDDNASALNGRAVSVHIRSVTQQPCFAPSQSLLETKAGVVSLLNDRLVIIELIRLSSLKFDSVQMCH